MEGSRRGRNSSPLKSKQIPPAVQRTEVVIPRLRWFVMMARAENDVGSMTAARGYNRSYKRRIWSMYRSTNSPLGWLMRAWF